MRAIVFGIGLGTCLSGCLFDGGEGTRGLACDEDSQCGRGIECIAGVCGGSEACTFSYENALVDEGNNGIDIHVLLLAPAMADTWGNNHLGPDALPHEEVFLVEGVALGVYDTRVIDEDEHTYTKFEITCDGDDWHWKITADDID